MLTFAVDPTTREVTDSSIGDRDVPVAGLMPFTLPDGSHTLTDPDWWSAVVPPGWKTGVAVNPATGEGLFSSIANRTVTVHSGSEQTLAQADARDFPADGVALVIAPADRVFGNASVLTPPLSIDEFNVGSAGGGTASTLDTAWFEGNGRLFGATIRIGRDASAVDLDAIGKVVASLSFLGSTSPAPTCTARDLMLGPGEDVSAATEQNPLLLELTNVSFEPCRFEGYPEIVLTDRAGEPIPSRTETEETRW